MDFFGAVARCLQPAADYYCPCNSACAPCKDPYEEDDGCCVESKFWRFPVHLVVLTSITLLVLGILGQFESTRFLEATYHTSFMCVGGAVAGISLISLFYAYMQPKTPGALGSDNLLTYPRS